MTIQFFMVYFRKIIDKFRSVRSEIVVEIFSPVIAGVTVHVI